MNLRESFDKFWRELSRAGDPERISNKIWVGYRAGWEARKPEWIPVETRVPQVGEWRFDSVAPNDGVRRSENVPIITADGRDSFGYFFETTEDGGNKISGSGWVYGADIVGGGTTHWFELPEKP